jgi:malate dehydrogenase (oxaloacetate-decarboxylating)(NADP+)
LITKADALAYHADGRPGKIQVVPTKPTRTQRDLSMAYTPGVAEPCREIFREADRIFEYTGKGNLVAVVTNGSAVLGLGNIGAQAAKPVMEGKAVLFKRFADIDVFDLELDTQDPEEIIRVCQLLAPTFGGINLEDIRAPDCFGIETRLIETLDIPVFHDDQHGTAIISGAAFLNGLEITDRKIDEATVVFSGAGAAGVACAKQYLDLGVRPENITMVDSHGVIYAGRTERMNPYKEQFARETPHRTLAQALVDADAFIGVSTAGVVTPEMVKGMAPNPLIFAMANPDPEITPNQVNNVLGFPFIFRGALDVRARTINEEMKKAAVLALAELARRGEAVPDVVRRAYPDDVFDFGSRYIIPKPFDPRVLLYVAPAVAQAAMESGVARQTVDLAEYERRLEEIVGNLTNL